MMTAVKEVIAQARNFEEVSSTFLGFLVFSDTCSLCISKSREAVQTQLGQNRATAEPNSDISRSPHR